MVGGRVLVFFSLYESPTARMIHCVVYGRSKTGQRTLAFRRRIATLLRTLVIPERSCGASGMIIGGQGSMKPNPNTIIFPLARV